MGAITTNQIIEQSKNAYNQWKDKWRIHAKHHSKYNMKSIDEFQNIGLGRPLLICANGYSLELNIETIKEYKDQVDIMCCDKSLGHLIENGIKPKYCMVCDASVDYKKYMEKYKDDLSETILFQNVCGNPEWTDNGNWQDIYFYVCKDVLKSEREFCQISKCNNIIPAGTNVSNSMVVFVNQCDENHIRNFFGYDKYLLIGYDYSWDTEGKYYAFDYNGKGNDDKYGKVNYMRHVAVMNHKGELVHTSSNLHFSAKWLQQYISTYNIPIVQCSTGTILNVNGKVYDLKDQINYSYKEKDQLLVKDLINKRNLLQFEMKKIMGSLNSIGRDHFYNFIKTT